MNSKAEEAAEQMAEDAGALERAAMPEVESIPPPEAQNAAMTEEWLDKKLQIAWDLFESVEGQVEVADHKVEAIFAANTLLVAAISFQSQSSSASVHTHGSVLAVMGVGAHLLLLASICVSSLSAIVALFPRLRTSAAQSRTLLFFGDIAALPDTHFVEGFLELPTADKVRQILRQVHTVSRLVAEKFKWTRRAGGALVFALLLWIFGQVIQLFSGA